jgi:alpha-D-xyloside xylohydrolase
MAAALALAATILAPFGAIEARAGASAVEKVADGIVVKVGDALLKIEVCSDDVVRVLYAKDRAFFARKTLAAAPKDCAPVKWQLAEANGAATVSTAKLKARVDVTTGAVTFLDASGKQILAERKNGRTMTPAEVQGERTNHVRQIWEPNEGESLYGLGQQQLGLMDIKGYDLDLWQHNTTVAVPVLVSSRGYGIFWDNTSYTRFGDLADPAIIPAANLYDADGKQGGLTGSYFAGYDFDRLVATRVDPTVDIAIPDGTKESNLKIHPELPAEGDVSVRWEGSVMPDETGDYLFRTFSGAGIKLWIDGKLVVDHWRQGWLTWHDVARVHLEKGRRVPIRLEYQKNQGRETVRLMWNRLSPERETALWSDVADGIDYYFLYGPDLDRVVSSYRQITGKAPMMPKWVFGLWQSRQRYNTAQESLDVLAEYRKRGIPVDNIVQDWFYWKEDEWGSQDFDPKRFPDPQAWIDAIHDKYHARLMISVWPKYYPGTKNFEAMQKGGYLYRPNLDEKLVDWVGYPSTFYDAFNPAARELFWQQMNRTLFTKGIDAWWLDATEPDLTPIPTLEGQKTHMHPTAMGTGSRVLNAFPLVNAEGVYEGQRKAAPNQRVFILTRSAFAGQQRYASATWSGDISSTWSAMRKQIPAGLGFSLSGIPYWSMDIGGFSVPPRFSRKDASAADVEEWRELNARWFQFGTFVPLTRLHGEAPLREPWEFGGDDEPAYKAIVELDRLRYRMLPYVYSLAGDVTHDAGTIMRPLVMDFREDAKVRDIGDEYMFGPALLVSPVTEYRARSRSVYLPAGVWYDMWSGAAVDGGRTIDAPAPFETIPVHVRAGSILPFGPELQYTTEKPADPVTLYVYEGADGAFTLYEDDGLTYDYERGKWTKIPIAWNQAKRTLTIGTREGSFDGMLEERTFEVVFVSKAKPVGVSSKLARADKTVRYTGRAVEVRPGS